MCSPPRCRRRLPASRVPESGGKSAALGNRDCPAAGSRRLETAAHALARRPVHAYPPGSRRPRGEPARPIPIGGSSSAVPCNKIFKTPFPAGRLEVNGAAQSLFYRAAPSSVVRSDGGGRCGRWKIASGTRMMADAIRSDLTDAEWELVRSLFETYPTLTKDIRAMVDGCLYLGAEGCRWRSLPKDFGPWQTVRGYWDRFRRDGVWADVAALLTPAARARLGKAPAPSTGIVDSRSVTSGPQKGERGVDGNKKVRGIKRHLLTCSFGFVLAVLVSAANLHDTHGLGPLLERAAEAGWDLRRVKVDAIYAGPVVRAAADRHAVDVQVSLRDPTARGFAPLPVRWRIEATFGTLTNRYRRLTRNLEQSGEAAENVVEPANLRRVLRVLTRLDQNLA